MRLVTFNCRGHRSIGKVVGQQVIDLPASLLSNTGGKLQGATITLAMQNVKMWTRYGGADPEVVSNPNGVGGGFNREDFLTLPNARKVLLRLNISF